MMLKLTYYMNGSQVTVLSSPDGIRSLYWQLTKNYQPTTGPIINKIQVSSLDGDMLDGDHVMMHPYDGCTMLDRGSC